MLTDKDFVISRQTNALILKKGAEQTNAESAVLEPGLAEGPLDAEKLRKFKTESSLCYSLTRKMLDKYGDIPDIEALSYLTSILIGGDNLNNLRRNSDEKR